MENQASLGRLGRIDQPEKSAKGSVCGGQRTNHRTKIYVGIMEKRQLNPRLVDLSAESFSMC